VPVVPQAAGTGQYLAGRAWQFLAAVATRAWQSWLLLRQLLVEGIWRLLRPLCSLMK
jgi:hypothetical protein